MNESPPPPSLICQRCGGFIHRGEVQEISGRLYCAACAVLPEVNYLERFRLKYWGRRDAWAYVFGLGGLFSAGLFLTAFFTRNWVMLLHGVFAVEGLGFFFGRRWARAGMFAPLLLAAGLVLDHRREAVMVLFFLIALVFNVGIYNNTRNKLFFRLLPSERGLQSAWTIHANNPAARAGFLVAMLGLVVWPLGPIALGCGVLGLSRVNPDARPPVGRKAQALTALVLGVLETAGAIGVLVFLLRARSGGYGRGP